MDIYFDGQEMMKLISTVRSYGNGAVIFAPPEFIAAMGPDAIVPIGGTNVNPVVGIYSPDDISFTLSAYFTAYMRFKDSFNLSWLMEPLETASRTAL